MKKGINRKITVIANQWSFALSLAVFIVFLLWSLLVTEYRNTIWVYFLIPILLLSFILAVMGIPREMKNDKKFVIRTIISLSLSLILILLLGFIYIYPVLFPFGIPPL